MQRENSILLMAFVLIVAIGFIGVNYGRVTGQAVSSVTQVTVTPSTAYPGDTITVRIDGRCRDGTPGQTLGIYTPNDQRVVQIPIGSNPRIEFGETAEKRWTIPTNIETGLYKAKVRDNCAVSGFVTGNFRII